MPIAQAPASPKTLRMTLRSYADASALMQAAAAQVVGLAKDAVAARGHFCWALAGGSTPRHLYELLAGPTLRGRVDWERVEFFWSDERCVSPKDEASNYHMAQLALLDPLGIPQARRHRLRGEVAPELAAREYHAVLRQRVSGQAGPTEVPRLDLVLLGLGEDGHTASLFPGTAALDEAERWVVPSHSPQGVAQRLTFTLPLLNAARSVIFLVSGSNKAAPLRRALAGADRSIPASLVRPVAGTLDWYVDEAAFRGASASQVAAS